MNTIQLQTLASTLSEIAKGAEWQCQWEADGWGPPLGRDVEYCLRNNVPIRIAPGQSQPMPSNTGGPAFPQILAFNDSQAHIAGEYFCNADGMSLRDYIAVRALQAHLSIPNAHTLLKEAQFTSAELCCASYEWADEMLAARAAGKEGA